MEAVRTLDRLILTAQAAWASKTIHLAPEPPGERSGLITPERRSGQPLELVMVGDSMVAGCGVPDQSLGMAPRMAADIAQQTQRPVRWQAIGKLGATARRVRYRLMPQAPEHADYVVLCVGSNDVMARRTPEEWREDIVPVLDDAVQRANVVVLASPGQVYNNPALPKRLRTAVWERTADLTALSRELCAERGVIYADFATWSLPVHFWADDRFHPSEDGYQFVAEGLAREALGIDWDAQATAGVQRRDPE